MPEKRKFKPLEPDYKGAESEELYEGELHQIYFKIAATSKKGSDAELRSIRRCISLAMEQGKSRNFTVGDTVCHPKIEYACRIVEVDPEKMFVKLDDRRQIHSNMPYSELFDFKTFEDFRVLDS